MKTSKDSLTLTKNVQTASSYVHTVHRRFRRKGMKSEEAIQRAADDLGISNHLAWCLYYRQRVFTLSDEKLKAIQSAYLASLDKEIAEMERLTANLRAIKADLQKTMAGNASCCDTSYSSSSSSVNGAFAVLSLVVT